MPPRRIANSIRSLRQSRGLSQADLGRLVGARQAQISAWERGLSLPNAEHVLLLCAALQAPVEAVFWDAHLLARAQVVENEEDSRPPDVHHPSCGSTCSLDPPTSGGHGNTRPHGGPDLPPAIELG